MRYFVVFTFLFLQSQLAHTQSPDSVRVFLDSALHVMEQHSMFTKNLDWTKVTDSAHQLAKNAATYGEAATAIRYAFNQLGDKHGWVVINDTEYHNPAFPLDTTRNTSAMKEAALYHGGKVFSKQIENYAYLNIPYFGGQTMSKMNAFAQRLQDSLCRVITPATKGIIIDLRLDGGGNVFPMLVGVSNVLGNGIISQTKDANGKTNTMRMENYRITLLDTIVVKLEKRCGDFTKLPVAVLIGPMTGSSGEGLAITFSTRPKTVLIGERTAGYTTGNQGFLLPGVNNGLILGENFMTDKNGKEYKNGVQPAIEITGGDNYNNVLNDAKIKAALKWLRNR